MYEIVKLLRTQWYTIVVVVLFISCNSGIKHKTETYHNPIISGFAPDPIHGLSVNDNPAAVQRLHPIPSLLIFGRMTY